ncbi:hypothetical protein BDV98DRAFT_58695 [Pterulicium gracile]|uniref:Uncharacterized protein n=1 Tax=Pterulicium gracile TaxID=1884261 RepID=A0A5C3Q451_9AGAR|nr:hypothetical protein BDV98DRAFT_58695 [Pterula gracilis]
MLGHSATSSTDHSSSLGHDVAASSIGHSDSSRSTASTVTNAPARHPNLDAVGEKSSGPDVRGGEYREKGQDTGYKHARDSSISSLDGHAHHQLPHTHTSADEAYTPQSHSFSTYHTRMQSNDGSHSPYPDSDSGSLLYDSRPSSAASTSSHANLDRTASHRSRRGRPTSDEADGETGIGMALLAGMLGGDDDEDEEGSEDGEEKRDVLPGLTGVESVKGPPRRESLRRNQHGVGQSSRDVRAENERQATSPPTPSIHNVITTNNKQSSIYQNHALTRVTHSPEHSDQTLCVLPFFAPRPSVPPATHTPCSSSDGLPDSMHVLGSAKPSRQGRLKAGRTM